MTLISFLQNAPPLRPQQFANTDVNGIFISFFFIVFSVNVVIRNPTAVCRSFLFLEATLTGQKRLAFGAIECHHATCLCVYLSVLSSPSRLRPLLLSRSSLFLLLSRSLSLSRSRSLSFPLLLSSARSLRSSFFALSFCLLDDFSLFSSSSLSNSCGEEDHFSRL